MNAINHVPLSWSNDGRQTQTAGNYSLQEGSVCFRFGYDMNLHDGSVSFYLVSSCSYVSTQRFGYSILCHIHHRLPERVDASLSGNYFDVGEYLRYGTVRHGAWGEKRVPQLHQTRGGYRAVLIVLSYNRRC